MDSPEIRTRADMIAAGMTLHQQHDLILEKLARLKSQIDGAKAKATATGDYSDRDWFNRANFAHRMLAREHQQIQREIGERNKAERKRNGDSQDAAFISVARRRLDPELFQSIMDEAHDRSSATPLPEGRNDG